MEITVQDRPGVAPLVRPRVLPSAAMVGAAAALFPNRYCAPGMVSTPGQLLMHETDLLETDDPRYSVTREAGRLHEGPAFFMRVGPGVVQLRARDLAKAERTAVRNADLEAKATRISKPVRTPLPGMGHKRSRIKEWSQKSRRNFTRKLASLDFAGFEVGDLFLGTLTYPGDWLRFARSASVVKYHLDRFRRAWADRWDEPLRCVWKLEFQRRGAPHFHLLTITPEGASRDEVREWAAEAWSDIVFGRVPEGVDDHGETPAHARDIDYELHRAVGAYHDSWAAARCSDIKRIAVYFTKHGLKSSGDKEYQHIVPSEWTDGCGRFWGVMGIDEAIASVKLLPREYVQLRRLLRRHAHANGRRLFAGGRLTGGYSLFNDAPAAASQLARALALSSEYEQRLRS